MVKKCKSTSQYGVALRFPCSCTGVHLPSESLARLVLLASLHFLLEVNYA